MPGTLVFYEAPHRIVETVQALESDAYYGRLRNPSEMSRAIFPKFRDTWRTICTVEQRWGDGIGAAVLTLRMKAGNTAPFDKLAALETVRVDLLTGQANVGQAHTAEKDLRATPDRQIERALVAFFFWAFLWGIPGAFIGIPVTIALLAACERNPSLNWLARLLSAAE